MRWRCLIGGRGTRSIAAVRGAVAHLGERVVRNDEVVGSIPICSKFRGRGACVAAPEFLVAVRRQLGPAP